MFGGQPAESPKRAEAMPEKLEAWSKKSELLARAESRRSGADQQKVQRVMTGHIREGRCVISENYTAYVYWRPRCVAELYCLGLVRNEIAARNCGVTSENWIPMPEFGRT